MARLLDCPLEVIQAVLQRLSPTDLYALCLTNKALRILAEPHLYSTIEWTWERIHTPPPIDLLLRSLLRRPELSQHVRTLIIRGCLGFGNTTPPTTSTDALDMDKVIQFIQSTTVPFVPLWIDEALGGTVDSLFTALVSQLSNITHLGLGSNLTHQSMLFGMMLRSALVRPTYCSLPNFQKLQKVTYSRNLEPRRYPAVRGYAGLAGSSSPDALSLFYLPAVQHISACITNPAVFSWPAYVPDPSTLTSLDISMLREPHLGGLLRVTKSLQKLRWQWWQEPMWGGITPIINLEQLLDALSHVRETLTDLSLTGICSMNDGGNWPPLERRGSLRDMVGFHKLVQFRAPLAFFHSLPSNVEDVTIGDDFVDNENYDWGEGDIFDLIRLWLETGKESTPSLRKLSYSLLETRPRWGSEMRAKMTEVCTRFGVEVDIIV
ncbi:hypothetical protein B0T10DRAFT_581538 [Thelonectria olida]|uniref:F-box domain-containing protein n=1 Tax=Thelonectria olida TaxID=1576542 RepID=A0A9P8VWK1_9HYPO|nr:hypothetical protein B0T10DRAFT_581538 [Thelonectria olida]